MIELIAAVGVGLALAVVAVAVATRKRRAMQRHPAPTFVFADLVGYTRLTERHGDETAARIAREFRRTMCELSREHGAWQVKSMGDGVMIWASDPGEAVALAVPRGRGRRHASGPVVGARRGAHRAGGDARL